MAWKGERKETKMKGGPKGQESGEDLWRLGKEGLGGGDGQDVTDRSVTDTMCQERGKTIYSILRRLLRHRPSFLESGLVLQLQLEGYNVDPCWLTHGNR